jgi:hypothetical protein
MAETTEKAKAPQGKREGKGAPGGGGSQQGKGKDKGAGGAVDHTPKAAEADLTDAAACFQSADGAHAAVDEGLSELAL